MDDGYIHQVNPVDQVLSTTVSGGGDILSYYWRVRSDGFTDAPTVQHIFNYDPSDDDFLSEGSFVPGKVLEDSPLTRSYEDEDVPESETIDGTNNLIIFNGQGDLGFPLEAARLYCWRNHSVCGCSNCILFQRSRN